MDGMWDSLHTVVSIALAAASPVILVILFFRQRQKRSLIGDDGPILGTDADRLRAEDEMRAAPLNIRERLLQSMDVQGRYAARDGFDARGFDELLGRLRAAGIECDVHFQPSLPMGVGDSFLVQQGLFELFVERGRAAEAAPMIERWLRG